MQSRLVMSHIGYSPMYDTAAARRCDMQSRFVMSYIGYSPMYDITCFTRV